MVWTHGYTAGVDNSLVGVSGLVDRRIVPHLCTIEAVKACSKDNQRTSNLQKERIPLAPIQRLHSIQHESGQIHC